MEKVCAVVVFLSVYQLAGMFHYHDGPILKQYQITNMCNTLSGSVGWGRMC